jgi:predicted RNase H-like HicB family nuclease
MIYVLSDYIDNAMGGAEYDKLEDDTFTGRIPSCPGVVAFGDTLRSCQEELRSVLEDWILVGLRFKHPLPVIAGLDLNKEIVLEPLESM